MTKDAKPDLYQLNLRLFTDLPLTLPLAQQEELRAALGDMLLNALIAPEGQVPEADNESETHA